MALKTVTTTHDDIDGSPEADTYVIGFGGQWFSIDLAEKNQSKINKVYEMVTEHGRPVDAPVAPARRGRKAKAGTPSNVVSIDSKAIRAWAADNYDGEVSSRGRLKPEIIAAYEAAHAS